MSPLFLILLIVLLIFCFGGYYTYQRGGMWRGPTDPNGIPVSGGPNILMIVLIVVVLLLVFGGGFTYYHGYYRGF